MSSTLLRPIWLRMVPAPWVWGLVLGVGVVLWRFALLLAPHGTTNVWLLGHFVVLAALPFVLFSRVGRTRMGLTSCIGASALLLAIAAGAFAAMAMGALGGWLYSSSADNWYVTVGETMLRDARLPNLAGVSLFLALAVPAAILSPIGEELFFRGLLQETMAERFGAVGAGFMAAAAFGVMHVAHHGMAVGPDGLVLRAVSGTLWVLLVTGLGLLFVALKSHTGSIWSAIVCHASFNVAMVAWIVLGFR